MDKSRKTTKWIVGPLRRASWSKKDHQEQLIVFVYVYPEFLGYSNLKFSDVNKKMSLFRKILFPLFKSRKLDVSNSNLKCMNEDIILREDKWASLMRLNIETWQWMNESMNELCLIIYWVICQTTWVDRIMQTDLSL